jgi:hypothetical protein
MTTMWIVFLLTVLSAALLSGIGVCRLRLLSWRASKRLWVLTYGGMTMYSACLVVVLLFQPFGMLGWWELCMHAAVVLALLALVGLQTPDWRGPAHADHAPTESNRAPLGEL